ncbi:30S ribosomal protein S6 [Candidatus Saccharibacteria bacterium]|nr:30S ribosomal protein S6 [Candidatus Saccharibacteria bacterium]
MKQYELTFLIHPDLEMNTETVVSKVKELIDANGGKVVKEANEGKKRLAYTIKGQDYAIYYYLEAELPAEAPAKISSVLNITDEVLRYLLVAVDERKLKAEAKRAAHRAARAEEQEAQEEKTEEE